MRSQALQKTSEEHFDANTAVQKNQVDTFYNFSNIKLFSIPESIPNVPADKELRRRSETF